MSNTQSINPVSTPRAAYRTCSGAAISSGSAYDPQQASNRHSHVTVVVHKNSHDFVTYVVIFIIEVFHS